jgi:hypothetical protein
MRFYLAQPQISRRNRAVPVLVGPVLNTALASRLGWLPCPEFLNSLFPGCRWNLWGRVLRGEP